MLDLDRARVLAAELTDESPVTVSGRWLRQAILEIAEGRAALTAALDFPPAGEIPPIERLAGTGAFTALVASHRRNIPAGAR
jgi:hypothetical protein